MVYWTGEKGNTSWGQIFFDALGGKKNLKNFKNKKKEKKTMGFNKKRKKVMALNLFLIKNGTGGFLNKRYKLTFFLIRMGVRGGEFYPYVP